MIIKHLGQPTLKQEIALSNQTVNKTHESCLHDSQRNIF